EGGGTQIELIRRISTDLFGIRIKIRANQQDPRYPRSFSVACGRKAGEHEWSGFNGLTRI
ncbi:MAG: hypothetical protein ACO3O0_09865, partial [Bacteroidia bacterium]